jgi:hypothetical protein
MEGPLWSFWLILKQQWTIKISSPLFLFLALRPSWLEVGINGHKFRRGPSKNHFSKIWLIFELYKHNDEVFSIYYRIFYELWTFADFDRLCKLEKRGDEIKKKSSLKLLSQSQPNFAEMFLVWSSSKFVSGISEHQPRWPPQPNLI